MMHWTNPSDCLQLIQRVYPDLEIATVRETDFGQNNYVLIADDAYVFRFPRYEESQRIIEKEIRLWRALQNKLPLSVPNPIYNQLHVPIGEAFMGYEMLNGDAINIYALETMFDDTVCNQLAQQLAEFLTTLHHIPTKSIDLDFDVPIGQDYWQDIYQRIKDKLYDRMRPDACINISNHFELYLEDAKNFDYTPCLIHGDFGTGNILFDAATQSFTAVIDLSPTLGDPAIDFAALYGFNGRGKAFFQRIAKFYPQMSDMMPRILFYSGTFALLEALHGIENDDADALKAGLDLYI